MFLGTFVPKLDEKGRIILPAKFRDELRLRSRDDPRPGALPLRLQPARVRGPARAGPPGAGHRQAGPRLPPSAAQRRQRRRCPTSSTASRSRPCCATTPASDRELTVIGAGNRAEIWDTAAWNDLLRRHRDRLRRHRRGGDPGTLLVPRARPPAAHPAYLPRSRSERMGIRHRGPRPRQTMADNQHPHPRAPRAHRRAARPRPRAPRCRPRRRDARDGRPRRGVPRALPRPRLRRASTATRTPSRSRASGSRDSATASTSCTRSTTGIAEALDELGIAEVSRHPVRPRGLVDAARPGRARLLVLEGCAARHAHGPDDRGHRRRDPRRRTRGRAAPDLLRVRRGEARPALRAPHRRSSAEREPITTSARARRASSSAATPAAVQRAGHPAKRVFQALRIEVNQELSVLERAIPAAIDALAVGGRIVVLAYQSLEDRIVKRALQARSTLDGARAACRSSCPSTVPSSRSSSVGPNSPTTTRSALNPRATPVRCAPPSESGEPHERRRPGPAAPRPIREVRRPATSRSPRRRASAGRGRGSSTRSSRSSASASSCSRSC